MNYKTLIDSQPNQPDSNRLNRGVVRGALLSGALIAVAFQQSPMNEVVRTAITVEALELSEGDKEIAAIAAGTSTALIEGSTSALIAAGVSGNSFTEKLVARFKRRKSSDNALKNASDSTNQNNRTRIGIAGDSVLALTLGPGLVVLRQHLADTNRTFSDNLKTGLRYTALGSVVSGAVFGYGIGSLRDISADIDIKDKIQDGINYTENFINEQFVIGSVALSEYMSAVHKLDDFNHRASNE